MKVFFDTSVIVAAVIEQHTDHPRSFAVMERVQAGEDEGFISCHSLAETYAILTKVPPPHRHSPEQALLSIDENILKYFRILSLSVRDYIEVIREAATSRIHGGTIYDALLLRAAARRASTEFSHSI